MPDVDASVAFHLRVFAPQGFQEAMRYPVGSSAAVGLAGPDGFPHSWVSPAFAHET